MEHTQLPPGGSRITLHSNQKKGTSVAILIIEI